jgi:NAD(P)-dependent dehydrogenase (short-subunit alcohol dehydrogenase family)
VNCAGISGKTGRIDEIEFEDYKKCLEINLDALWLCEKEELKCMMEQESLNGYDTFLPLSFSFLVFDFVVEGSEVVSAVRL